jgi:hypothetical protein
MNEQDVFTHSNSCSIPDNRFKYKKTNPFLIFILFGYFMRRFVSKQSYYYLVD